eukprot:g2095.t1
MNTYPEVRVYSVDSTRTDRHRGIGKLVWQTNLRHYKGNYPPRGPWLPSSARKKDHLSKNLNFQRPPEKRYYSVRKKKFVTRKEENFLPDSIKGSDHSDWSDFGDIKRPQESKNNPNALSRWESEQIMASLDIPAASERYGRGLYRTKWRERFEAKLYEVELQLEKHHSFVDDI